MLCFHLTVCGWCERECDDDNRFLPSGKFRATTPPWHFYTGNRLMSLKCPPDSFFTTEWLDDSVATCFLFKTDMKPLLTTGYQPLEQKHVMHFIFFLLSSICWKHMEREGSCSIALVCEWLCLLLLMEGRVKAWGLRSCHPLSDLLIGLLVSNKFFFLFQVKRADEPLVILFMQEINNKHLKGNVWLFTTSKNLHACFLQELNFKWKAFCCHICIVLKKKSKWLFFN